MPKFLIRVREIRVHEFEIEAAKDLADDLECGDSIRDSFDSQELLDVEEIK